MAAGRSGGTSWSRETLTPTHAARAQQPPAPRPVPPCSRGSGRYADPSRTCRSNHSNDAPASGYRTATKAAWLGWSRRTASVSEAGPALVATRQRLAVNGTRRRGVRGSRVRAVFLGIPKTVVAGQGACWLLPDLPDRTHRAWSVRGRGRAGHNAPSGVEKQVQHWSPPDSSSPWTGHVGALADGHGHGRLSVQQTVATILSSSVSGPCPSALIVMGECSGTSYIGLLTAHPQSDESCAASALRKAALGGRASCRPRVARSRRCPARSAKCSAGRRPRQPIGKAASGKSWLHRLKLAAAETAALSGVRVHADEALADALPVLTGRRVRQRVNLRACGDLRLGCHRGPLRGCHAVLRDRRQQM